MSFSGAKITRGQVGVKLSNISRYFCCVPSFLPNKVIFETRSRLDLPFPFSDLKMGVPGYNALAASLLM